MRGFWLSLLLGILAGMCLPESAAAQVDIRDDNTVTRRDNKVYKPYSKVTGIVVDSLSGEPVGGALVSIIYSYREKKEVRHTATNNKGAFTFPTVDRVRFKIEVTSLGYLLYSSYFPVMASGVFDLGKIPLQEDSQDIDAVVVKTRLAFFTVHGDTIKYNPKAVKTLQDDMAYDLLLKMPGVNVSDGFLTIQGEKVERTYVNGQLIYGDEERGTSRALNSVKASEVEVVRSYHEIDADEYLSTGKIKRRRVLDVLTFNFFSQHTQADALVNMGTDMEIPAGGDRQVRYAAGASLSSNSEARQVRLGVLSDNIWEDAFGGSGSGIVMNYERTPKSTPGYDRKTNAYFSYERPVYEEVTISVDSQQVTQKEKRFRFGIGYQFDQKRRRSLSTSEQLYFPSTQWTSREQYDTASSSNKITEHKLLLDYSKDKRRWSLSIRPEIAFITDRTHNYRGLSSYLDGREIGRSDVRSMNDRDGYCLNLSVTAMIPITKRRTWQLYGWGSYGHYQGDGVRIDSSRYSAAGKTFLAIDGKDNNFNGSVTLEDRLQLSDRFNYGFKYQLNYKNQKNLSLAVDEFSGELDSTLTRDIAQHRIDQSLEFHAGRELSDKFGYEISFGPQWMLPYSSDRFPAQNSVSRNIWGWRYGVDIGSFMAGWMLSYSSYLDAPMLESGRLDYDNPLNLTAGNPRLKPSRNHTIRFSYDNMMAFNEYEYSVFTTLNITTNESGSRTFFFRKIPFSRSMAIGPKPVLFSRRV